MPRDGPYSVPETTSSWQRTLTLSTSCFLAASNSSILLVGVCTHEPRRPTRPSLQAGASPKRQRDAPPSCAPAWPPAGPHAQRENCPPKPAMGSPGSPPQQQARVPGSTDLDAPSPRGNQRRAVGPCWARVRCPTRRPRPRPRPRPRADVGRDCSEPKLATRPSSDTSLPVARALAAEGILGAVKGTAALTRSPSSSTVPRTRHAIRPAAPSLRLDRIGCSQRHGSAAAGCSMCRPQRDWAQVALGCNTEHVVATQCAALLRHACVAQRRMSRRAAVVTQMSAGD